MQKTRIPQNSFQFGEVSDTLSMRTDSPVYAASASKLENMIVTSTGSVKKRYGTKYLYDYSIAYNASYPTQSRLFDFTFSDDEQYLISIEHAKVRCFYLNQATGAVTLVETITADTASAALPFDRDYLKEYTAAQYGDVMFICHPLFMPRMLVRTSLTDFEVTPFSFDERLDGDKHYQPYASFQSFGVTLDPSSDGGVGGGAMALITSQAHWIAGHVGSYVKYDDIEIYVTTYVSATEVSGVSVEQLKLRLEILNPLRTTDGSAEVEVTHLNHGYRGSHGGSTTNGESITISGASAVGGINTSSINGTFIIQDVIDENTYTYTAGATANDSEDGGGNVKITTHAPTIKWSEQAFSAVRGYPAAVVFHENRLCFAGTIAQPDAIWMSGVGNFFNFDVGEAADADSINLIAATGHVNEIRYMISNRDLQIFGAAGELYVPTYLNQAITPTNAQIRLQTPFGCDFTQPVSIDGATVFVQNGGNVVREYLYTDAEDAYTSTAISTIASHLISNPKFMTVSHGAFQGSESYVFMTNGDNNISLFNSNRAERRAAWTQLTTSGSFDSVCALHDRVFVNIYDPDGNLVLCEFEGDIGLDRYITTSVSGNFADVSSAYSVNDVVQAVSADGLTYYGEFTVVNNGGTASIAITLSNSTSICVGVKFTAKIESNAIDAVLPGGAITGDIRGISTVVADLKDTRSVKVNNRVITLSSSSPFSGKKEYRLLGYSRDPKVTIEQNEPLPLHVKGFVSEVIT